MADVLLLLPLCTLSSSYELDHPLPITGSDGGFQYDDGTAYWLTWSGLYRATWFDADDFVPGVTAIPLHELEFWLYHHTDYPWDTASFIAELWNGSISMLADPIDASSVTACHNSPCHVDYGYPGPGVQVGTQWWIVINTEMSAGGWPSVLGDNTPQVHGDHSFSSYTFTVWEPWIVQDPTVNGFFIRCDGYIGLEASTWGYTKTLLWIGAPGVLKASTTGCRAKPGRCPEFQQLCFPRSSGSTRWAGRKPI